MEFGLFVFFKTRKAKKAKKLQLPQSYAPILCDNLQFSSREREREREARSKGRAEHAQGVQDSPFLSPYTFLFQGAGHLSHLIIACVAIKISYGFRWISTWKLLKDR